MLRKPLGWYSVESVISELMAVDLIELIGSYLPCFLCNDDDQMIYGIVCNNGEYLI